MSRRLHVQIVVPLDPAVVTWVERWAAEQGIKRAEALRRLVDIGRQHAGPLSGESTQLN